TQIARGEKSLDEVSTTLQLNARIMRVQSLNNIFDFTIIGLKKPSTFEQYSSASMSDQGIHATIRSGLPTYSTYFCVARDVFGAFIWHNFFEKQANAMDIVNNLTTAVTSNISAYVPSFGFRSYFGLGTSRKDLPSKPMVADSRVETAYVRQFCRDKGRLGDRLFMAPKPWNLLAVADQSARVLVLDTETRKIIRIFKGYRNARVAWIESSGKVRECRRSVKALFLVIFAPKRALLEVWAMQNGPRVSAFNVDPRGRLITLPGPRDGVLGTPPDEEAIFRQNIATAAFVNSEGQIFFIVAPFRLAALGSSEASIHDETLYKEFKLEKVMGSDDLDIEKLISFIQELRTYNIRRKCIELVFKSSKFMPFTIAKSITRLMEIYGIEQNDKNKCTDSHSFLIFLQMLDRILRLYNLLRNYYSENIVENSDDCIDALKLYESEIDFISLNLLKESTNAKEMTMPKFPSLKVFVDQFDILSSSATFLTTAQVISGNLCFAPKDENGKYAVLSAIFAPFIFGSIDIEEFEAEVLPLSGFSMESTIEYLTTFWLHPGNKRPISFVNRLVTILRRFQKQINRQILEALEVQIKASENVIAGLFFLLSIRSLQRWEAAARGVAPEVEEGVDAFDVDDQWEQMDEYIEYCDLLSHHLLILTYLDLLPDSPKVCLNRLAEKGVGYYREQI
uniref:Rab3-GAP regulatory subunit N-terminal domain-containing protein n=1 Tax=Panagrolaimus sp. ES5 TaxID=591445 RepID=A0AC34G258_9BILA